MRRRRTMRLVVLLGTPEAAVPPEEAKQVMESATSSALRLPLAASSVAATPLTCGVAIEVPDRVAYDESDEKSVRSARGTA